MVKTNSCIIMISHGLTIDQITQSIFNSESKAFPHAQCKANLKKGSGLKSHVIITS